MSRLSDLYRKIRCRIIALAILLSIFTTCIAPVTGLAADSIKILGNGTVVLYEWRRVKSNNDLYDLYRSNEVRHCLFVYNPGDGSRYVSNYTDGDEWWTLPCSSNSEIKPNNSRFITTSDLMTPVLIGATPQDPDWKYYANGGTPYIYRFKIGQFTDDESKRLAQMDGRSCGNRVMGTKDSGSGRYIGNGYLPDSWYKDAAYLEPTRAMRQLKDTQGSLFSIAVGDIFDSDGDYETSIGNASAGQVKIWHTNAGVWDVDDGWNWCNKGWLGMCHSKEWSDYDDFIMWIATPHTFSVIKQNYTIEEGQVVTIDGTKSHCMLYEGYTLTVKDGGVLNIKGKFINNGVINCDGGTIIMHENACMFPYNTKTNQSVSSGATGASALNINGGELIVLSGATLAYDSMHDEAIRVTDNKDRMGKIINYGKIFATGIRIKNSVVYNESSGILALGKDFEDGFSVTSASTTVSNGIISNSALSRASWGTFATISGNTSSVIVNSGNMNLRSTPESTVSITNKAPKYY